ncbi:MAG: sulfatase [Desulfobacterales bacterium RIFOXYA12_FULL_46_15]|nr:MAG: sulfatase [Desulfobacterales bacterium RIFOXYA12_FULL_46_15]
MRLSRKILIPSCLIFFFYLFNSSLFAEPAVFTNKLGMRFVLIPAGSFIMGSPESEEGRQWNETQHKVIISRSFYMGETEVTQGQWKKLVGFNPSSFPDLGKAYPVDSVSWNQCVEFIRVLNEWEKTNQYRLPTEAEWEYACRAESTTAFAGGGSTNFSCNEPEPAIIEMAWYCYNSGTQNPAGDFKPGPVKTKLPNKWGIYDMHGNVQEWVQDSCEWRDLLSRNVGAITDTYMDNIVDPLSKTGTHRIFRGGAWHQSSKYQRSAYRGYYKPVAKRNSLGFRIVRMQ